MNFPTCTTCKWFIKNNDQSQFDDCTLTDDGSEKKAIAGLILIRDPNRFGCYEHETKGGERFVNFK